MDKREPRGNGLRSLHDPGGFGLVVMMLCFLAGMLVLLKVLGLI